MAEAQGVPVDEGAADALQSVSLAGVDGHREALPREEVERVGESRRREPGLGPGDVESDDAAVAMPQGELGDLLAAIEVTHRRDQLADPDVVAGRARGVDPGIHPLLNRLDSLVEA